MVIIKQIFALKESMPKVVEQVDKEYRDNSEQICDIGDVACYIGFTLTSGFFWSVADLSVPGLKKTVGERMVLARLQR